MLVCTGLTDEWLDQFDWTQWDVGLVGIVDAAGSRRVWTQVDCRISTPCGCEPRAVAAAVCALCGQY